MTTTQKAVLALAVAVAIVAIYGAYLYPKASTQLAGASPNGAYFLGTNVAATVFDPISSFASSTSILNSSGSTWYIE